MSNERHFVAYYSSVGGRAWAISEVAAPDYRTPIANYDLFCGNASVTEAFSDLYLHIARIIKPHEVATVRTNAAYMVRPKHKVNDRIRFLEKRRGTFYFDYTDRIIRMIENGGLDNEQTTEEESKETE